MGFVARAEADMDPGKEIERLNGVILSLDQTVDKQDREITDLQRQVAALKSEDSDEINILRDEAKLASDKAVKLTEIIKARESRINELTGDMEEVQANFAAIRESNERLRQEKGALEGQISGLKADNDYWVQQYQLQLAKQETSEAAYLKVIKVLTGRE